MQPFCTTQIFSKIADFSGLAGRFL